MPRRFERFFKGGIYHIFNKTLDHQTIFEPGIVEQFLNTLAYYREEGHTESYFSYRRGPAINKMEKSLIIFECLAFCFMPNHFHFLLKQCSNISLSKPLSKAFNSFTRAFNLSHDRHGPLFIPQFKAVEIHSEQQLKHTSRYIHLNPYSAGIVKNLSELDTYPFSSLPLYLGKINSPICNYQIILSLFGESTERYKEFVHDQAEAQKNLALIKQRVS